MVFPEKVTVKPDRTVGSDSATQTAGLAERTSAYFKSLGLNVIGETNADRVYSQTTLIDYSGKPYTLSQLKTQMKVDTGNIFSRFDPNAQVDIVVIVGEDWAANNTMP